MNILPTVTLFLMLLSLTSYTLFQGGVDLKSEKASLIGYADAQAKAISSIAKKAYSDKKGESKARGERKLNPNLEYKSRRHTLNRLSSLNIVSLFDEGEHAKVYKIAQQLIHFLYKDAPFYRDGLEISILKAMIAKGKKLEEVSSLVALFPDDDKLREIFYKMMKGSGSATGYPPLGDFLRVDPGKKFLSFPFASIDLLKICFGEEVANAIIEEERKLWEEKHYHRTVKQGDLGPLLLDASGGKLALKDFPPMDFRKKIPKKEIATATNETTGIVVKRKHSNSDD